MSCVLHLDVVEDNTEAIARIRAHGIDVSTEMIIGADGDDENVFDKTFRFIMDHRIAVPRVHILTPVPGTPLWDAMNDSGRITSTDYERFSGGKVVFEPSGVESNALARGYWSLYEKLFTWRSIVHRLKGSPGRLGAKMRAVVLGTNIQYRQHVQRRICPGIV